jgi:DNA-binding LacI/PurR family transcriptional regulator
MREIARRANVSIGTVSRVLNRHEDVDRELRDRVEAIAHKVGYQFTARTRSVIQAKSRIISLVLFNDAGLSSAQSLLLLGVETYCSEAGYYLLFARHQHLPEANPDEIELPALVQTPGLADCVIVIGSIHAATLKAFDEHGFRYVLLRNHLMEDAERTPKGTLVGYDDRGGCYQAAKYLVQLGHKHIWYIGDESKPWHRNRLSGYSQAMSELGLEPHIHTIALSDDEFENGQAAVSYILDQGWPITAILAGSDELAFGAREGVRLHRRDVPKDISLIGFEHQPGRTRVSNLTSVAIDAVEVGRQLAKAAVAQIERGDNGAANIMIPATLVKRSTCRPLRKEEHMML